MFDMCSFLNYTDSQKNGALWIFPFTKEQVVIERDGVLREYMMNPEKGAVVILVSPSIKLL